MSEEMQEHRYHQKNAFFLQVEQRPPDQRDIAAYVTFKRLHARLQEKVRLSGKLSEQDLVALEYVANLV